MRRALVGLALLAVLAGGVYWWKRGSGEDGGKGSSASSALDKLRTTPLRTRWAPPLCKPTGVIRTHDGAPAKGAIVALHPAPLSARLAAEIDPVDTTAGPDGAYTLPATAAGAWILIAAVPGVKAGVRPVTIGAVTDCNSLDITLGEAGRAVTGIVTDVSGGGIVEAMVVARPTLATSGPPVAFAMTRGDGRYELTVADGDYAMEVRHPAYVGVEGQIAVRGPTTFDAVLTPGASIRGIVLTRDKRQPLAGARITVAGGRASGAMGGVVRETTTDDDGKFAVTGLGSGRIFIAAVGPSYATHTPVEIALGITESRDGVEVLVDPARRIRGVVTRAGQPLQGALVSASLFGDDSAAGADERSAIQGGGELSAETDASGVFEIWGVAPSIYDVEAEAPQSLPAAPVRADATRGDVDNIALEVGVGVAIRGHVVPAQVATVSSGGGMTTLAATQRWIEGDTVTTGPDGRFELTGATVGETTVSASTYNGLAGETTVTVGPAGANDVTIQLATHGVTVSGRVVDAAGKPVPNMTVGGLNAITSTDGSFTATGVEPGQITLTVMDSEDELEIVSPKLVDNTLDIPPGGISNLAITVETRDRTMRGVVIGADGKPAPDTWVIAIHTFTEGDVEPVTEPEVPDLSSYAFDWSGRNKVALTDADGRFTITGLRAGSYDVAAEGAKGGARGVARNAPVDRPVTVQLIGLGGITVAATQNNAPVGHYQLEVFGPEPDTHTVNAADGKITLTHMPPGQYTLRATSGDFVGQAEVTLAQGASTSAAIALGGWATITGIAVDIATGKPLAGVTAYVEGGGSTLDWPVDAQPTWITDASGRFTIPKVLPGRGEVVVYSGAGDGAHVAYTAAESAKVDIGTVRVEPPPPSTGAPGDGSGSGSSSGPGSGSGNVGPVSDDTDGD